MQYYEIIIRGHIDKRRASWFEGFEISHLSGGNSVLSGEVLDQATLHFILNRIRDMGLQLLSVNRKEN